MPPSSGVIAARQNDDDALRLLIAQRRLHSRAKRWQSARWVGLLIIGLAAPVATVVWPKAAVAVGAIAGVWIFLGRTLFSSREAGLMQQAAITQEDFDRYVFGMPRFLERTDGPSLEDVARLAGETSGLHAVAVREQLLDWYPVVAEAPGARTVAVAQRANAEYSHRLLRSTVTTWVVATACWVVALVVLSLLTGMPLATFLLGVALPVLPAALDATDYLRSMSRATADRADVARTIEQRIRSGVPIEGEELLVWQERMFDLRRVTPQVPDWLYRLNRNANEREMETAASQLANQGGEES